MNIEKLALVAGDGTLPLEILQALRKKHGIQPKVYLLADDESVYHDNGFSVHLRRIYHGHKCSF